MLYLESCPPKDTIMSIVQEKLCGMSRFRSVLKVNRHGGSFVEVDEMDWDYHFAIAFEDQVASEEDVVEYVGGLYDRGLDISKPLWSKQLNLYLIVL